MTSYHYDPLGRLKTRTASGSGTTIYGYDGQGSLETVTTPRGTTTYTYADPRGLLTGITPSTGGTTLYGYNANGTRTSTTNPRGGKTTYRLDGHDRPKGSFDETTRLFETSATDGYGRVVSRRAYEATDPESPLLLYGWTEYEYDAAGRQTKEIRKLFPSPMAPPFDAPVTDVVTETRYDAQGRVSDVIDPIGRTTHTGYDGQGRVNLTVDPAGNEVGTDYDAAGNARWTTLREKRPDGGYDEYLTENVYDDQGRLEKVIEKGLTASPLLRETRYEYDQAGRRTKQVDPDGGETTFEYDQAGRRTKETDPIGAVTRWQYDEAGNLLRLTDANGNHTTYAWDAEGRLTHETRGEPVQTGDTPTLPTWRTTWDVMGNRSTVRDPNGTVVTYHYDDAGRLTGRSIARAPGVEGPTEETKVLDPLGRPTAWTSAGSGVDQTGTAAFDSLDRLTRETLRLGTGPLRAIDHEYDLASQQTALVYPSGRRYLLEPDPLGRLREVRDPSGLSVVRYEDLGRRQTRKTFGNNLVEERTYGPAAWLKTLTVSGASPSPLLGLDYATRNLRGLKLDVVRTDRGTKDVYTYDAAGRITTESLGLPEPPPEPPAVATPDVRNDYTLDGLLNIRKRERTRAGATVVSEPGAAASGVNTRNQYTQWGSAPSFETLTYDPNGNLTAYSGATLRYDVDNRLTTATTAAGSYEAFHDPDGQRVREVRTSGGATVELDVVQSGQRVLEVFPKDGTTPIQRFVHGRGIDEVVLAELDPTATGTPTAVYPLQDELCNVTHLTDASGAVIERYQYEGYGKFRIFDPAGTSRSTSAFGWNRLFQGREYLGLIDAYDFRARILWPELGRFGQEDPAGTGDSLNRYQAFGGAWLRWTDSSGRELLPEEGTDGPVYSLVTGQLAHYVWQRWVNATHGGYMGYEDETAWYDKTLGTIAAATNRPATAALRENIGKKPDAARWDQGSGAVQVWELKPATWDPEAVGLAVKSRAAAKLQRAKDQVARYVSALRPANAGISGNLAYPAPGNEIVELDVIPELLT